MNSRVNSISSNMDLKLLLLSFVFFIGSSGEAENSGLLQELQTAYSEVLSRLNQAEVDIYIAIKSISQLPIYI